MHAIGNVDSNIHLLENRSRADAARCPAFLINKRHQTFSAPHVIGVLRAKRARQGILLHIDAVNESHANRQKYDKQRGPVGQRQSETRERQGHTGLGRMTHNEERSALEPARDLFQS